MYTCDNTRRAIARLLTCPITSQAYDENSRLESAGATTYTYDWVGNAFQISDCGLNRSADEVLHLLRASDLGFRICPYYYHFDALGSTRMLTDESGHITDSYSYDAWGNLLTHDPNSISQPYQYVGQLGYYTHWQDVNLPMLQLGVRFYDQEVGRFGQRDQLSTLNYYSYAGSRPLVMTDEWGLRAKKMLGCTAKQKEQLGKEMDDASNRLPGCIESAPLRDCIKDRLQNGYIRCGNRVGETSCVNKCGYTDPPTPREHIHICPEGFENRSPPPIGCGKCVGSVIVHEFAHSCTKHSKPGEYPEGPKCERDCYGEGSPPCPK